MTTIENYFNLDFICKVRVNLLNLVSVPKSDVMVYCLYKEYSQRFLWKCTLHQGRKSGAKAGGAQGGVNLFFYFGDQKKRNFQKQGGVNPFFPINFRKQGGGVTPHEPPLFTLLPYIS
jgi:hypothetical protein